MVNVRWLASEKKKKRGAMSSSRVSAEDCGCEEERKGDGNAVPEQQGVKKERRREV